MQMEESVGIMRHSLASVLYWGAGLWVSPHPAALNRHFQPHLALLTTSVSKLPPLTAKFHLPRVYFLHRSHTLLLFGTTPFMPFFPSHAIASVLYVCKRSSTQTVCACFLFPPLLSVLGQ